MTTRLQQTIGRQVAWLSLFPLLIMAVGLEAFYLHDRFKDLNLDMRQRGQLIARQLASGSEYGVFSRNADALHELAEKTLLEPDVIGVVILDASGTTLTSASRPQSAPDLDSGHTFERPASLGKLHTAELLRQVGHRHPIHDNGEIMLIFQPILTSQVMLDGTETDARQAGAVLIELSWRNTVKFKSKLLGISVSASVIFIFFTYLLTLRFSRRITEPVEQLSNAIKTIGAGDLDTRVTLSSCITELCTLANGINQMTTDLRRDRDDLQARINEATVQLRELAFYDTLTHLPNRRLLEDRLSQSMAASKRSGRYGALMFLDLDNFKPINDSYGHAAGDLLLVEAAKRISHCLREMDTVARFGGDEFVVLLNELSSERADSVKQAHFVAEKIRSTLEQPYHITQIKEDGSRLQIRHHCSCSVGITLFMNHDAPPEEIMIWADTAMYQAKQDGRNLIRFHEEK